MQTFKKELLELLRRNDLLRASLLIGRIQDPSFAIEPYVEKVMSMAARVWNKSRRVGSDPIYAIQCINKVLFEDSGLVGKTDRHKQVIDDPSRYYLHNVLDKKQGSPVALTILYSIIADQIGLKHECLALPSYFLIKVPDVTADLYVDPFENGRVLSNDDFVRKFRTSLQRHRVISNNLYERVDRPQLVAKLAQQLKHCYILKSSSLEALRAVEILAAIFPHSPELTRDRGILYCEMEYFSKAAEDLKFYLKQRPEAEDIGEIKRLANMLKGYREVIN